MLAELENQLSGELNVCSRNDKNLRYRNRLALHSELEEQLSGEQNVC